MRSWRTARLAVASILVPLLVAGVAWTGADRGWGVDVPVQWWDLPMGRRVGCTLFNRDVDSTWVGDPCRTGVDGQAGIVVVLGDQHADGVAAGVEVAARRLGLGTAVWNRTGCPLSARTPVDYPRCREWQESALRLVDDERPVAVVVANQSPIYLDPDSTVAITDAAGEAPSDRADAARNWEEGTTELLARLNERGVGVVIVGPAPDHGTAFPRARVSVLRPTVDAPTISAATARRQRRQAFAADRRAAATQERVAVVDPIPVLCPGGRCPTKVGDEWWYYDARFLTATGGRRLAPEIERALRDVDAVREG